MAATQCQDERVQRRGRARWLRGVARTRGRGSWRSRRPTPALLRRVPGVELLPGFGTSWISATVIVAFAPHHPPTDDIVNSLADQGVGTRALVVPRPARGGRVHGLHAGGPCPVTNRLTSSTLGLPCFSRHESGRYRPGLRRTGPARLAVHEAEELVVAA